MSGSIVDISRGNRRSLVKAVIIRLEKEFFGSKMDVASEYEADMSQASHQLSPWVNEKCYNKLSNCSKGRYKVVYVVAKVHETTTRDATASAPDRPGALLCRNYEAQKQMVQAIGAHCCCCKIQKLHNTVLPIMVLSSIVQQAGQKTKFVAKKLKRCANDEAQIKAELQKIANGQSNAVLPLMASNTIP